MFGIVNNGQWQAAKSISTTPSEAIPARRYAKNRESSGTNRQWDRNIFAQGSFRKNITPFYNLMVNGKYAYDYLRYLSDPRLDVSTMYVDNHYRQHEFYVSAANELAMFKWWSASLSVDCQYNTLDADLAEFVYPRRSTLLAALATSFSWDKFRLQGSLLYTHVSDRTSIGVPRQGKERIHSVGSDAIQSRSENTTSAYERFTNASSACPRSTIYTIPSQATNTSNPNTPLNTTPA